jgi:hypothetical protein
MIIIAAEISWMNHFIGIQVLESESSLTHRMPAWRCPIRKSLKNLKGILRVTTLIYAEILIL